MLYKKENDKKVNCLLYEQEFIHITRIPECGLVLSQNVSLQGPHQFKNRAVHFLFLFFFFYFAYVAFFRFFFLPPYTSCYFSYNLLVGYKIKKEQQPTVVTYTCKIWSVFDVLFDISYTGSRLFTLPSQFFIGVPLLQTRIFFCLISFIYYSPLIRSTSYIHKMVLAFCSVE